MGRDRGGKPVGAFFHKPDGFGGREMFERYAQARPPSQDLFQSLQECGFSFENGRIRVLSMDREDYSPILHDIESIGHIVRAAGPIFGIGGSPRRIVFPRHGA